VTISLDKEMAYHDQFEEALRLLELYVQS